MGSLFVTASLRNIILDVGSLSPSVFEYKPFECERNVKREGYQWITFQRISSMTKYHITEIEIVFAILASSSKDIDDRYKSYTANCLKDFSCLFNVPDPISGGS